MRLHELFVTVRQACLVSLPLLPPFFFPSVLQSSLVKNKLNKHFQDIWVVKGYADLVHSGVAFTGVITQGRNEEFPYFNCFEKQVFSDLPRATVELYRNCRKTKDAFSFWVASTTFSLVLLHSNEAVQWGDKEEAEAQRNCDLSTARGCQVVSNGG